MTDDPDEAAETPMQRALRLRQAALAVRPKAPGGTTHRQQVKGVRQGASKPWMKQ